MIKINCFNGFDVAICGDYFKTLVYRESQSEMNIQDLFQLLKNQTIHSEIILYQHTGINYVVNVKSRKPLLDKVNEQLATFEDEKWVRQIYPVMPILSGVNKPLPFSSVDGMMALAEQNGIDMADLAVLYESERAGIDPQKVILMMRDIVLQIKNSIHTWKI